MKQLFYLVAFISLAQCLQAQQLPVYSVYREQWGVLNPAATSNNYSISEFTRTAATSYRRQFFGLTDSPDAPNTQILNLEWLWEDMNSLFGGHVIRDQTGLLSQVGLYGRYAYQLKLGFYSPHIISMGLAMGIVRFESGVDGQVAFENVEQDIAPFNDYYVDFNLGIHYQYKDKFYVGVSIPQLLGPESQLDGDGRDFSIKQVQHYYGVAGYYMPFDFFGWGDESSYLESSVWLKYVPSTNVHYDMNMRYVNNQLFWFGLGGSSTGMGHVEAGLLAGESLGLLNSQFKIGVAYDQPVFTPLAQLGGSFEVNISYSWY